MIANASFRFIALFLPTSCYNRIQLLILFIEVAALGFESPLRCTECSWTTILKAEAVRACECGSVDGYGNQGLAPSVAARREPRPPGASSTEKATVVRRAFLDELIGRQDFSCSEAAESFRDGGDDISGDGSRCAIPFSGNLAGDAVEEDGGLRGQ